VIRGFYASATGLVSEFARQEVAANNLANIQTVGYKRSQMSLREVDDTTPTADFDTMLASIVAGRSSSASTVSLAVANTAEYGAFPDPVEVRFDQGALQQTENELDVALVGDGFLAIKDADDNVTYTRAGNLARSADGILVTSNGQTVIGSSGPINVGAGRVEFDVDGTVLSDGREVGRLALVDFDDPTLLTKVGVSDFAALDGAGPKVAEHVSVRQGYVERSNVEATEVFVDMMAAKRAYEASQRMLQYQDRILASSVNDIGRLR
jgi:flagellar basal-body rod protein FlgF